MKQQKRGIQDRIPHSATKVRQLETKFIEQADKTTLTSLSLDELASRFEDIEQQSQLFQGRILLEARGRFTNKNDFGAWVQEQGGALSNSGRQHRNRLMNLARFFDDKRPMDKISITSAYEISAPINAEVAVDVYKHIVHKNIPVGEVRKIIAKAKAETMPLPIVEQTVIESVVVSDTPLTTIIVSDKIENVGHKNQYITGSLIPNAKPFITGTPLEGLPVVEDEEEFDDEPEAISHKPDLKTQLMAIAKTTSPQLAIVALQQCIVELNAMRYQKG